MIKKFIINNSMNTIKNYYPDYSEEQIEKIQYGLEAVYLSLTKIVVILLLAVLLNILKETIIVLLLFNLLRTTGFGIHASKSWGCWITSVPTFIGVPLLCKYIEIPSYVLISIGIISMISLALFAPADTIKRPLIRKNRRTIYKILTIVIGISYFILSFITGDIFLKNALICSMLIEAILVCPITYKLTKTTFNNYKNFTCEV